MLLRFFSFVFRSTLVVAFTGAAFAQEAEPIEIKTIAGLRYDPPRFVVKPGAKVKLEVENVDDMAHNLVLVTPGTRMEVVTAALTMPITPEQTFIPQSDSILQHTPVLTPGKSATLEFTAPATEGVYPYICTYPGHGAVMYGAMYVTNKAEADLPPVVNDENLPDIIRDQAKITTLHAYPAEPPYWYRIFMRDSGPASIAVALPGGQNYCWDAGACRLRYAWKGAFVDPLPHWRGNGDAFAEVKGQIYYRPGAFPVRIGDAKKEPAEVRFRGFNIVDKYPEFRYNIGDAEVRELIKPAHHGGIETIFKVTGTRSQVYFVNPPGAGVEVASDAGKFVEGVLKVPAAKAKQFLVTFIEVPNREALGYWSMNDTLHEKKPQPVEGVKGRALVFDGKKSQFATGIKSEALSSGATFAVWGQLTTPANAEQIYIGAKKGEEVFALGANLAGVSGYGVRVKNAKGESKIVAVVPEQADENWHHLAATLDIVKGLRFYLDGKPAGMATFAALPANTEFYLGSSGGANFTGGTFDEARIYGRMMDAKEIAALYESERGKGPPKPVAKVTPAPTAPTADKHAATPSSTPKSTSAAKATPAPKTTPAPKATPTPKATPAPKATPTPKPTREKSTPTPKPTGKATPKPAR
jgi:uncharacterized cupredoxin-like copper-binding protein